MDKGLLTFLFIGLIAIYLSTNFIGSIQEDVDKESGSYKKENQYEQYYSVDIIGDTVLDVQHVDISKQLEVWNNSELKEGFLELFPDFESMKRYVDGKIIGDALKTKLLQRIDSVEIQFLSGTLNGEQSKAKLESIN
jgi:hypothetical protein